MGVYWGLLIHFRFFLAALDLITNAQMSRTIPIQLCPSYPLEQLHGGKIKQDRGLRER